MTAELPPQLYVWGPFFALLALGTLVYYVVRIRPVNRARRARGQTRLRWRELGDMRASTRALVADEEGTVAEEAAGLVRQMAWERQQAGREMVKYGRAMTRAYCREHDRFCMRPWERPHPPGGKDNPLAPDGWVPDDAR